MSFEFLPSDIRDRYEVHNFRHAGEILSTSYSDELQELTSALRAFYLTKEDILSRGGNESRIPKRIASLLLPNGWHETRLRGKLVISIEKHDHVQSQPETRTHTIENYLDGHKIDFVKNRVAFDLEWNSKDQTFDRDLFAFRAFHEAGVISAAVLLTRSEDLNEVFRDLGVLTKYGASTTWMGKLLYRLRAGRGGACPVLVFGITKRVIKDI